MNNKIRLLLPILALSLFSCNGPGTEVVETTETQQLLDSLFERHQYFQVRQLLQKELLPLSEKEEFLIKARLHSVFNERSQSNAYIDRLMTDYPEALTDKERNSLLETRINNSVFLFDYAAALKATEEILKADSLSEDSRKSHQNTRIIYQSLRDVPAQKIRLEETQLPIHKDLAGLSRIPVRLNSVEQQVIFDTGANYSVITDSLALRAGIRILGEAFEVEAITGGKVSSRIGVADSLQLGHTLLNNVVFLVFPEASLSFPEADYTIDAILGFPVINALEELMIIRGEQFLITDNRIQSQFQNLALDFLTPIVEVYEASTALTFTFDTGANSTALYPEYFKLRQQQVLENGVLDSLRFGGAGGTMKTPVYYTPFSGSIGGSPFQLDSAAVHVEDLRDYPGIYGNLGQDVLSQFDTLFFDFREMSFMLK